MKRMQFPMKFIEQPAHLQTGSSLLQWLLLPPSKMLEVKLFYIEHYSETQFFCQAAICKQTMAHAIFPCLS